MSGHVAEPRQNAKVRTKALPARGNPQRPLFKADMKGRDDVPPHMAGHGQYFPPTLLGGGAEAKETTGLLLN